MTHGEYPVDEAPISDLEYWLEAKSGFRIDTQEFKRKVELHKVDKLSDKDVVKLCYDLCGWIYCG